MSMAAETQTPPAQTDGAGEKLDFKKVLPIFVIVLIDLLGLTIIIPLMPLYAASFGADPVVIGLLGAAFPVMQFIGAPILGRLSDRYGRRPVLIVSQIGTLIGFLILGFAGSLWMLFVSRIVDGLSGANISTAQAVIADSTTEKTRTQGLGLLGAAFGLGFIIGPVIAAISLAVTSNNYHVPAFVAAAFSLISILLSWFWLEESHKPGQADGKSRVSFTFTSLFKALSHPAIGLLLILMFAQQIAFGGFEQLLALFTLNRLGMNASGNAVLFVFVGIIVVMVQGYFIGKWSRRIGDRKLIYLGLATLALGLFLSATTPTQPPPWYSKAALQAEMSKSRQVPGETPATQSLQIALPDDSNTGWLGVIWLYIAMIPASIGGGILQPTINSMITKRVGANERGGTLGISAALLSGANAVAPVLGGAIFAWVGASAPFIGGALIMAALLAVSWAMITDQPIPAAAQT